LIFIKKSNQTELKKKLNRNRFKPTGFGSVQFGFLGQKPVWFGFFGLALFDSVFLVWPDLAWFGLVFFLFGFGSVFSVLGL
jgi:hypothetical protein